MECATFRLSFLLTVTLPLANAGNRGTRRARTGVPEVGKGLKCDPFDRSLVDLDVAASSGSHETRSDHPAVPAVSCPAAPAETSRVARVAA
jgi:hypothetical protein